MNLQELVDYRNSLEKGVDLSDLNEDFDKVIKQYSDTIEGVDPGLSDSVLKNIGHFNTLKNQLSAYQSNIEETIEQVNQKIREQSQQFFTTNYALELELQNQPDLVESQLTENIRTMRFWRYIRTDVPHSPDAHVASNLQKHCTFQYPTLEIGCRDGEWTKYLVAGDPLYVADYTEEFLHNAVHQFTSQYVPRIRPYIIKDNDIKGLPENQFGFIFSYNFFNYLAFDTIKEWMRKVQTWLRPGGSIMFTYNNADMGYGAGMAMSRVQSYCPKSMLIPMCESIGLECTDSKDYVDSTSYNPFSWIQFTKPGELSTIKVGQALGEIKRIVA